MEGRRMAGDRRGSQAQGPGTQAEAVICPGEQDWVNPGPAPPPTGLVEGSEEPRDQSPEAESLVRMSASTTPIPNYQDDSKFFTKKTRSDSTSAPGPRDTKQTVS